MDKEGKVTGVSEGTTKITAHLYTADGIECIGADCSCNVEVAKVVTDIEDGDYSVYVGEDISLPYTVEGKDKNTGESKQLPYKIYGPKGDIKFSSSDESVASVDKIGVVTAHKAGTANITLKANGVETVIKVTVEDEPNSPYMAFLEKYEGDGEAAYKRGTRVRRPHGKRTILQHRSEQGDGIDDLLTYEIANFRVRKNKSFHSDDKNIVGAFQI